ncbi:MAG TPA: hypothetical protein DD719_02620 [Desulfotomaculum sp.]|nr:hypothetical protein [Desulfotomaculum sp.]
MLSETTKLFTNVWRYIQFSTANQFFMIANDYGLDTYRIFEAMTYKYPRTQGLPRPGFTAEEEYFNENISYRCGWFSGGLPGRRIA